MKKVNGFFTLSTTDKKKTAAHCRAVAKKAAYSGYVEAWLDTETGEIYYLELIGSDYIEAQDKMEFVYAAPTNK